MARRLIYVLLEKGFLEKVNQRYCYRGEPIFDKITIMRRDLKDRILTVYSGFSNTLLKSILKRYMFFRDQLIILTGDPEVFEIFGFMVSNKLYIPGLPDNLYAKYVEILNQYEIIHNSIFIVWNNYRKYIDDAKMLIAIVKTLG